MSIVFDRTIAAADKQTLFLYDNLLKQGTLTTSSETTDGTGDNAVSGSTNDYWIPATLPATLEVDLGSNATAAYVGIASHNLGSRECTVSLEAWSGTAWVEVGTVDPVDNTTLILAVPPTESDKFRLYVDRAAGSILTTFPSIGVAFIGPGLKFEEGVAAPYTPLYMSQTIELLNSETDSGQFIINRVIRRSANTSFNLNVIERATIEGTTFQAFLEHYNEGEPFFFASSPSNFVDDVGYCWRATGGELRPTLPSNGLFYTLNFNIRGYLGT